MIRLRSEHLSHPDFAYFFLALVLALVTALDLGAPARTAFLRAAVLATAVVVDHPRLLPRTRHVEVTLGTVVVEEAALRRELEDRLGTPVVEAARRGRPRARDDARPRHLPRAPAPRRGVPGGEGARDARPG